MLIKTFHYSTGYSVKDLSSTLSEVPIESIAFAAASCVALFFKFSIASALGGISLGLIGAKLATKAVNLCNPHLLIELTKKSCILVKRYPRLQFISFIFTLVISHLSKNLGFGTGIIVGGFAAIILDVQRFQYIRRVK
ncbi:MAG: hypothetical protein H0X29_05780 [Parachlamydiaceae bacterium]|nr:hypothetical protein [Parachlamydiaceae bacterium]